VDTGLGGRKGGKERDGKKRGRDERIFLAPCGYCSGHCLPTPQGIEKEREKGEREERRGRERSNKKTDIRPRSRVSTIILSPYTRKKEKGKRKKEKGKSKKEKGKRKKEKGKEKGSY
jgi:hypothetical protein